jgi:hypothetical protein
MIATEERILTSQPILKAREAWKRLGISRQALYKQVKNGNIPAYIITDGFTRLEPRDPNIHNKTDPILFLEADIIKYAEDHPVIGQGEHYEMTEADRAFLLEKAREERRPDGTISLQKLAAHARRKLKKDNTVAIPEAFALIDELGWPLVPEEQKEIDDILEKGNELIEKSGYVRRTTLFEHMQQTHGKGTRYYPVVAYVSEREHWPMDPAREKLAHQRRAGKVHRHMPAR